MKKTFFAVFRMLILGALMMPVVSCEKEIDDENGQEEIQNDPSKNTTDIAVTGLVEKTGFSYAIIDGYVNLNLLPSGNDNPNFGVEVTREGYDEGGRKFSTALTGNNKFSVLFRKLSPTGEYSYRTFVEYGSITYYGEYRKFTTKDFVNVTATGEATDITANSACISLEGLPNSFDEEESWKTGLAYSVRKSTLQPDSIHSDHCDYVFTPKGTPGHLRNLKPNTTYYYAAFTYVESKFKFAQIKSFTTLDHRQAIDLGLSVKWASCNVGATTPEEYGGYYAWGETEEEDCYDWSTYKWYNGSYDTMTKYCTNSSYGTVDNKTILDPEDDVAHVKWGDGWRMPTEDEIIELLDKCSREWATVNGVNGQKVTGPNGNSIFLPAAGYRDGTELHRRGSYGDYWSGTLHENSSSGGCSVLGFSSDFLYRVYDAGRCNGYTVRPVTE